MSAAHPDAPEGCPAGFCPHCYEQYDFPGTLSPTWLDSDGDPIDPDDGMCEDCYAAWLDGLKADRRALSLQRQQNEALRSDNNTLSAQLTAARGLLAMQKPEAVTA